MKTNGTLVERVANDIREAIIEGRLEPGERIGQLALAERFGTSRLPVREALRLLHNEGLVSLKPNAGARVASLTVAELTEVYLMRERLEPLALAESIPHLTDEEIATLSSYVDSMEQVDTTHDRWGWLEIDRRFHRAALAAAPMPHLLKTIGDLWNVATRYRRASMLVWSPSSAAVQRAEHRLLMSSIEQRNQRDAELILAMHIRRTRRGLLEHAELFGDGPRNLIGAIPGRGR